MRSGLDLRDSRVIDGLLGRPSRDVLAADDRARYGDARVLITGAGGSVGGELARAVAAMRPCELTLLDASEYGLFRIERELRDLFPALTIRPLLADVTSASQMARVVDAATPEVVFHSAAYKHVSMLERDVLSALRVNVLGSVSVARACREVGARLVLISSDKAANARSVMGASKRMAELTVLAESRPSERIAIVRFGNVLGSSGSVLELMVDRIRRGEPIEITDPAASRYFMSPAEAAGLVLKADGLARAGSIFWLEMGEPVLILDLAQRLLTHAASLGLGQPPIRTIGLRPGEKLREELTVQGLELAATTEEGVWIATQPAVDTMSVRRAIRQTEIAVGTHDAPRAMQLLRDTVPEYRPSAEALAAASAPNIPTPKAAARRPPNVGLPTARAGTATL